MRREKPVNLRQCFGIGGYTMSTAIVVDLIDVLDA
jgi:hypothetical protein